MFLVEWGNKMSTMLNVIECDAINYIIGKATKLSESLSDKDRVELMNKIDKLMVAYYDDAINELADAIIDIKLFFLEDK